MKNKKKIMLLSFITFYSILTLSDKKYHLEEPQVVEDSTDEIAEDTTNDQPVEETTEVITEDTQEESADEEKEQIQAKPRQQLVFQKNKLVKTETSKLADKKYELIPEEERENYLKNYK